MEIRVKRSVSIYPEFKDKFMELTLKASEAAKDIMGVEPHSFVNLTESPNRLDVIVYTDFESMAQYEEVFLHKALLTNEFLDDAEDGLKMIHDNPRDEMFVRLKTDDFFMNRKGEYNLADMSAFRSDEKEKYRVERLFCVAPGRLKESMAFTFEQNEKYTKEFNRMPDYFCTRFASNRIGGATTYHDVDNCEKLPGIFAEFDRLVEEKHPGLLMRATEDMYLRRITEDMLGRKVLDEEFSEMILKKSA